MRTLDTRKKGSKGPEGPGCTDHNESPPVVVPASGDAHDHAGTVTDADVIKLRPEEKKKLDVKDKLLLAPLTTVSAAESWELTNLQVFLMNLVLVRHILDSTILTILILIVILTNSTGTPMRLIPDHLQT